MKSSLLRAFAIVLSVGVALPAGAALGATTASPPSLAQSLGWMNGGQWTAATIATTAHDDNMVVGQVSFQFSPDFSNVTVSVWGQCGTKLCYWGYTNMLTGGGAISGIDPFTVKPYNYENKTAPTLTLQFHGRYNLGVVATYPNNPGFGPFPSDLYNSAFAPSTPRPAVISTNAGRRVPVMPPSVPVIPTPVRSGSPSPGR